MNVSLAHDLGAVVWKELKEYFSGGGGRGRYLLVIIYFVFGVLVPLVTGSHDITWVTTPIPAIMYGLLLPVVLIMSVGADSFAGERERHTLETLLASRLPDHAIFFGKLIAVAIFGWGQSLLAALVALIVINVVYGGGPSLYPAPIAFGIIIFGLLVALVAAAVSALVSLRAATVRQAQQMLSIGLVVIGFGFGLGIQALPASIQRQLSDSNTLGLWLCVVLVALAVLFILWGMALFRRARLILTTS